MNDRKGELILTANCTFEDIVLSNENNDNWQLNTDTGFLMPIYGGIFGELKHVYDYDNQPQQDTKKLDTRVTVGVGYQW